MQEMLFASILVCYSFLFLSQHFLLFEGSFWTFVYVHPKSLQFTTTTKHVPSIIHHRGAMAGVRGASCSYCPALNDGRARWIHGSCGSEYGVANYTSSTLDNRHKTHLNCSIRLIHVYVLPLLCSCKLLQQGTPLSYPMYNPHTVKKQQNRSHWHKDLEIRQEPIATQWYQYAVM